MALLSVPAYAGDGIFGTKSSPISSTSADSGSAMGAAPIAQMLVALLVVLALLKWLMPALIRKSGLRSSGSSKGFKVQESATLGAASVYVVEVRGRSFLVGVSSSAISCLAQFEDPAQNGSARPELTTFQEFVDAAPVPTSFERSALGDAMEQLDRLKRFGS